MNIAWTGHRPDKLGGYDNVAFSFLVKIARTHLSEYQTPITWSINGLAQGWDQAAAQATIDLGLPLWAVIPFEGQERKWSEKSQAYYRKLVSKASKVTVISLRPSKKAYQDRNQFMVDRANELIAMYDGSEGGTRNCIKYAKNTGCSIVNLYPVYSNPSKFLIS